MDECMVNQLERGGTAGIWHQGGMRVRCEGLYEPTLVRCEEREESKKPRKGRRDV